MPAWAAIASRATRAEISAVEEVVAVQPRGSFDDVDPEQAATGHAAHDLDRLTARQAARRRAAGARRVGRIQRVDVKDR